MWQKFRKRILLIVKKCSSRCSLEMVKKVIYEPAILEFQNFVQINKNCDFFSSLDQDTCIAPIVVIRCSS